MLAAANLTVAPSPLPTPSSIYLEIQISQVSLAPAHCLWCSLRASGWPEAAEANLGSLIMLVAPIRLVSTQASFLLSRGKTPEKVYPIIS